MLRTATGDEITVDQLYPLLMLRVNVFVVEQASPYPDLDGQDLLASTLHMWWQPAGELQGYLRLLRDEDGTHRIGRVCTPKTARGTGVGGLLMKAAMAHVGAEAAVLGAQTYATDFYARFGFAPVGEPYDEDGIEHVTMRRPALGGH